MPLLAISIWVCTDIILKAINPELEVEYPVIAIILACEILAGIKFWRVMK